MCQRMYGLVNRDGHLMGFDIDCDAYTDADDEYPFAIMKYFLTPNGYGKWLVNSKVDAENTQKVSSDLWKVGGTYQTPINEYKDLRVVEVEVTIKIKDL